MILVGKRSFRYEDKRRTFFSYGKVSLNSDVIRNGNWFLYIIRYFLVTEKKFKFIKVKKQFMFSGILKV